MLPPHLLNLGLFCCCAQLAAPPDGVPGPPVNEFGLTPLEMELLVLAAGSTFDRGARTCGDFFPSLLEGGNISNLQLAQRNTLLTKVNDLDAGRRLQLATTVCVIVAGRNQAEAAEAAIKIAEPPGCPPPFQVFFHDAAYGDNIEILFTPSRGQAIAAKRRFNKNQRPNSLKNAFIICGNGDPLPDSVNRAF